MGLNSSILRGPWWVRLLAIAACGPASAFADGKLVPGTSLPNSEDDEVNFESSPPALAPEIVEAYIDAVPDSTAFERPWLLTTPAGSTAFVLDRHKFQAEASLGTLAQRRLEVNGVFAAASYGLAESVTVGVGARTLSSYGNLLLVDAKWNFLNLGEWSYAFRPWAGFTYGESGVMFGKDRPLVAELAASRVIDDRKQLHFVLEAGMNHRQDFYATGDSNIRAARLSAAFALRIRKSHGITGWVAPEIVSGSDSLSGLNGNDGMYGNRYKDVMVGLGYQYFENGVGIEAGIESGPTWTTYHNHSNGWTYYYNGNTITSPGYDYDSTTFRLLGRTQAVVQISFRN